MRTHAGCCCTLLIVFAGLIFALSRLQLLVAREHPSVNTFIERDIYDEDDKFIAEDEDFMMAFAVEDYVSGEIKADKRFVKWFAEYRVTVDGKLKKSELPMYPCEAEDLAKFNEPNKRSKTRLT